MARTKRPSKFYAPSVDFIENGDAVTADRLDSLMGLKVGMKIRVNVPIKEVNENEHMAHIVQRRIEKIYKHHVLCVAPNGYKECFTKGEIFIYNYRKRGGNYERCIGQ